MISRAAELQDRTIPSGWACVTILCMVWVSLSVRRPPYPTIDDDSPNAACYSIVLVGAIRGPGVVWSLAPPPLLFDAAWRW